MDKTVGIIGLGIMGGAISRNLRERGWVGRQQQRSHAACHPRQLLRGLGRDIPATFLARADAVIE
jgi:3-hydroxyisobutyrate dehydrogenase-like beta-hydroxyacid dehydrogenase